MSGSGQVSQASYGVAGAVGSVLYVKDSLFKTQDWVEVGRQARRGVAHIILIERHLLNDGLHVPLHL